MVHKERFTASREKTPRNEKERVAQWKEGDFHERMVYENDLPPALETVEVTTVVPVHRELENGNFWRLLDDATQQTLDSSQFEIILVVNNTLQEVESGSPAYKDNQKLLTVAHMLRDVMETRPKTWQIKRACGRAFEKLENKNTRLSAWQKQIFTRAVERRVRFYAVDASSKKRAPFENKTYDGYPDYNIRGIARHIGGRIAYRRSTETLAKDESIIDFIDGDCGLPANYFEKIAASARATKEGALLKELVTYAPDIPDWAEKKPLERIAYLFHYLRRNITIRRDTYLSDHEEYPTGHGPSIAVRAHVFKDIGGYPTIGINEDFSFKWDIKGNGYSFAKIKGTHVRLSDRQAPTSVDGKNSSNWIAEEYTNTPEAFARHFDPTNLNTLEGTASYLMFAKSVLNLDAEYAGDADYRALRKKRWDEEVSLSKKRVPTLKKTVIAFSEVLTSQRLSPRWSTYTTPELLRGWLEKHIGGKVDAQTIDWLAENPIIVASIVNIGRMMKNDTEREKFGIEKKDNLSEMVWEFCERYLPEYAVVLPDKEPDYNELRNAVAEGTLPEGHSLRSLVHLVRATNQWERGRA